MKKINSWNNTVLYQYTHLNGKVYNVEIDSKKDKLGVLKCVHTSLCGYFEVYGLNKVIEKLNSINI